MEEKQNRHDYFWPVDCLIFMVRGMHETHRDGQFAQMVSILGQHSNKKRRKKNGISVSLGVHLSPPSENADADKRRGCKSV